MAPVAVFDVSDPGDPRIADYGHLSDPDLLATRRLFVAEGRLVVRRLLQTTGWVTRSVLVTPAARAALDDLLPDSVEVPVYVIPPVLMHGITGFNFHGGCLALGERPAPGNWRTITTSARRLVVLERVANADNVGSIFRNAAAFGADAVLFGPDCTDPLYRKAIRTSMGAVLSVPFASMAPWPGSLRMLQANGVAIVALTPSAQARPIREVAAALRGRAVALLAGHEGEGLTQEALAAADALARIPTTAAVDSLNVATAVAIALYSIADTGPCLLT